MNGPLQKYVGGVAICDKVCLGGMSPSSLFVVKVSLLVDGGSVSKKVKGAQR